MSGRIEIQATGGYGSIVEDEFARLLPTLQEEKVDLAPIRTLRDVQTASIAVTLIGTCGPVLIKEIFKTLRAIVKASHTRGKPVRAVVHKNGKSHAITTGDEPDDD